MSLAAIVLTDENWAIGKNGDQCYHLKEDMLRFRRMTMHNKIIYGRNTRLTFPNLKPLPDRTNIMLSTVMPPEDDIIIAKNIDDVLALVDPEEAAFVIGGASVYQQMLPYCDLIYRTRARLTIDHPDCYFPDISKDPDWYMLSSQPVVDLLTGFNTYPLNDIHIQTYAEIYSRKNVKRGMNPGWF